MQFKFFQIIFLIFALKLVEFSVAPLPLKNPINRLSAVGAKWSFGNEPKKGNEIKAKQNKGEELKGKNEENEVKIEESKGWGWGREYLSEMSCDIVFKKASTKFEAMLKGIFREEGAKRVVEAFKNIGWLKIMNLMRELKFDEVVSELRPSFEVLLGELIGGEKELLAKKLAQKSQDLRFMNAVVLLVLQNAMPPGCLPMVGQFTDVDKISIQLALKLVTTLHGEWKGKEQFLIEEMREKDEESKFGEISLELKNADVQNLFYALIQRDGKKIGDLLKEKAKEELRRELSGKSIGLFKFVVAKMLKGVPGKMAPWAPVIFEEQIESATNQLSNQIAPILAEQVPNILQLVSAPGKIGENGKGN